MTLCAAAICTVPVQAENQQEPKEEQWVLGISDRMLTSGDDVEFESGTTKIFMLHSKAVALVSGDYVAHTSIVNDVQRQLNNQEAKISEIANMYSEALVSHRRKRAELNLLAPLGLTLDSFISRQQEMDPDLVRDLSRRLMNENQDLGVDTIIAGVDPGGPHIYRVFDPGCVECHDGLGFVAVGLGARQFEAQFMPSSFNRLWTLPETLLLMYQAKKKAERSPGVGRATDVPSIHSEGIDFWEEEAIDTLEGYYNELEQAIEKKRDKLCERMANDTRLLWGPPEEDGVSAPTRPPAGPQ